MSSGQYRLVMGEKIQPASSWNLPMTGRQSIAIARLAQQLGIKEAIEESPSNRWEARRLIYELNKKRKAAVHKADQLTIGIEIDRR